jgi:hypothetical protein
LTVVAKLAAHFTPGQRSSAVTAGALRRIPEAVAPTTRQPRFEIVERADAPTTYGAL